MKRTDYQNKVLNYIYAITGAVLLAFAISTILKPSGLITGGITGISIVLEKLFHINYTIIYYIFSVLVLISAWIFLNLREAMKIILFSLIFPVVLIIFDGVAINFIEEDMILASIYYGIIGGAGVGLVLKGGFSQGGTDTMAKILHRRLFPFISISQILLAIDVIVIVASIFVFDRRVALYAILTQIVLMKSVNIVVFGFGSKKVKIEIVSKKHEQIAEYILNEVVRGITVYSIRGGYTREEKMKLVTICTPREVFMIKKFISEVDEDAFVDVLPVVSVWGKGIGFDNLIEEQ